ncbi:MAG: hypothetical protein R2813_08255, partial [Flavobacteriales bacterium]
MQKSLERSALSPQYAEGLRQMDSLYAVAEYAAASRDEFPTVHIPLVVHVLYENEEYNIPDSQIHAQIEALNRDFNWEQDDKVRIPEIWRNLGRSTNFRFFLADKDPDGNFTHGITRTKTSVKDIGNTESYYRSSQGGVDPWVQPHYVNIWVCIIDDRTLGFTYLPSKNPEPSDGIVIDP